MSAKLLAHRGYSEVAPENTTLAFDAARLFGFDGIEIDLHLTKDNELVVIHDENIKRTSNGKGKVEKMTLEEIRKYNFAHTYTKGYREEKIMTYEEFLVKYGSLFEIINVEIKTDVIEYKGIEQLAWDVHQKVKPKAEIIYSSFNFKSLQVFSKVSKDAILGFLFVDEKDCFGKEDEIKKICKYLHPWFKTVIKEKTNAFYKALGLPLNLWTFDRRSGFNKWTRGSDKLFERISNMDNVYSLISNSKY
ncbi:MAG: glycerophosphodiester phosphodiesterase [Mycoplasma sp.]|nr:glycerophosphodiester phosphodiesterase [Mycoplasma sp.]